MGETWGGHWGPEIEPGFRVPRDLELDRNRHPGAPAGIRHGDLDEVLEIFPARVGVADFVGGNVMKVT